MKNYFFSLLILCTSLASAQRGTHLHFTAYDTCTEPAKHHIATRTIITVYRDTSQERTMDSLYEKYNHAGNMVESSEHRFARFYLGGSSVTHYYRTYDTLNRLVTDSCIFYTGEWDPMNYIVDSYVYDSTGDILLSSSTAFHGGQTHVYYTYDEKGTLLKQCAIGPDGDTVSVIFVIGNTQYTQNRIHWDAGSCIRDTSTLVTEQGRVTETSSDHRFVKYYNSNGLLYASSAHERQTRYDSTYFTYDEHGQLIRCVSLLNGVRHDDPDYIVTHTEFIYDHSGRVVLERAWSEHEPGKVTSVRFVYDQNGLLVEETWSSQNKSGEEKIIAVKKVTYKYW